MSNLSSYTDDQLFDLYASNIGEELRSRGYEHGWYKKTVYVGEIYVLVNRAFPKLVKIGYSVDAKQRARQLSSNTAVPSPFHVYCIYRVKKELADKRLHDLIDTLNPDLHYAQNREFFKMSPEDAYGMLKAIAEMVGDEEQLMLNPYSDEYVSELLGAGGVDTYSPESVTSTEHSHKPHVVPDGTYYMARKMRATGQVAKAQMNVVDGKFIIPKGTAVVRHEGTGLSQSVRQLRETYVDENGISTEDVEFTSPSNACSFVTGASANGWVNWKCANGEKIDMFRRERV